MIYVVLGMHKSGTTLVSQMLHGAGINMGENLDNDVSYDKGNKYERESTLALNIKILGASDYEVRALEKPESLDVDTPLREKMQIIIRSCDEEHQDWGFKDPRTTLTYSLWKDELPEHRIIAIYRRPEEIWPRFRWQGWRRKYVNPYWAWQFMSRWMEHNISLIHHLADTKMEYLLLDYTRLMTSDEELQALGMFTGKFIPDRRNKDLYRQREPKKDLSIAIASKAIQHSKGQSPGSVMEELKLLRKASRVQLERDEGVANRDPTSAR